MAFAYSDIRRMPQAWIYCDKCGEGVVRHSEIQGRHDLALHEWKWDRNLLAFELYCPGCTPKRGKK